MNTEITDQILLDFSNWIKSAQGFLEREIPPTLHEYVVAIAIQHSVIVACCCLGLISGIFLLYKSQKQWDFYKDNTLLEEPHFWGENDFTKWQINRIVGLILTFASGMFTLTNGINSLIILLKCIYTPRIVLIEHITNLLK